ncbi:MAG: zf-HC2 domain-containing protein [Acidobacteria bacterium]|nr:zf-HC2 domain-containing protein [Acidobacteriota bacterium]
MSCRRVVRRLSAYLDGDLPAVEARAVAAHLGGCPECSARWRSLQGAVAKLGALPRLTPSEAVVARVMDRLEVESRGPGLALLFRPFWAARPLILPSLVPAALVLVSVLAGIVALQQDGQRPATVAQRGEQWDRRLPPSGTEGNPLFPSAGVSVPRIRSRGVLPDDALAAMGEDSLFIETVVARDGSVSTITLLDGDSERARPLLDALRSDRFEPPRYRGRPVAVSIYRLISRMEVRAPLT